MTRWFRFYDAALDDPKVQRLAPPIFKLWVNCLCVASRNNGILPGLADLAWTLRMSEEEVKGGLSALVAAGLLDSVPEGLSPHNWNERQYQSDSSAERMRRHRQKKRDGDDDGPSDGGGDVTVTPQNRTEADTETESSVADATGADAPQAAGSRNLVLVSPEPVYTDAVHELFAEGVAALVAMGEKESRARQMIGQWRKQTGDDCAAVLKAIVYARNKRVSNPIPYITASLKPGDNHVQPARKSEVFSAFDRLDEKLAALGGS